MIKLPKIKQDIIDEFYKKQIKTYKKLLKANDTNDNNDKYYKIVEFFKTDGKLDDEKIKNVIVGNIKFLLEAIKAIGKIAKPPKEIDETSGSEKVILKEGDPEFDFTILYKNFTNRNLGETLSEDIGISVCPYCNRSYIYTLRDGGIRPQYDHFFCKSNYPYLAVSIYNLIPCCSICNLAKSDQDTYDISINDSNFIYPYEDEYGYDIKFKTIYNGDFFYWLGGSANFKLEIDEANVRHDLQSKVKLSKNKLKLESLYEKHKEYVLDIIKQQYIYNESYVEDLFATYNDLFSSVDEIKDLIFMNYSLKEKWGDRILAKLTYDIRKEFDK